MEAQDRARWFGSLQTGSRDASGQLYRRSRYYDPNTGHFTQSDPIGLAGGLNTYGFAGGDPVSYGDPYGLKVCAKTPGLKQALSDAFQMQIVWDKDCVSSAEPESDSDSYSELQQQFLGMVQAKNTWNIRWASRGSGSRHEPNLMRNRSVYEVKIDAAQIGARYETLGRGYCGTNYGPVGTWTLESLVVHELIGHGGGVVRNSSRLPSWQGTAIDWENKYYAATQANEPERCY
ncbi:MAG TPA: RHS repeat-associated core domain-containing protein [Longimicrobium sp.]|nr:RHS repeat-associated core domain-containing protein [Longimicrobium sp.]